jgi:phosphoadenosine phosphosulfate reductase
MKKQFPVPMNPADRPAVYRPGPVFHSGEVRELNRRYQAMPAERRIESFFLEFEAGDILLSSSFGATSALLLHMFAMQEVRLPVYFIDTGFHFRETHAYREQLVSLLGLEIRDVVPDAEGHRRAESEKLWWFNPDLCCRINKNEPFGALKESHRVWVSGLMTWQTPHRQSLKVFEQSDGILKFHPVLDVREEEVWQYYERHSLPHHPLRAQGYESIGCRHCTARGEKRTGRWPQSVKTECGLHL